MRAPESYPGKELSLFANAHNWKRHFAGFLRDHIRGRVLEVGAGIGGTTKVLCSGAEDLWVALEPDRELAAELRNACGAGELPANVEVQTGTIEVLLQERRRFDTVLYIDVLEHIENDKNEMARAAKLLSKGGKLIVLSPAHQALFSEFDRSIGHYRRYDRESLAHTIPDFMRKLALFHLDSIGFLASVANRAFLKQSLPTSGQIVAWDRLMIPLSRLTDPLVGYRFGKSIVGIWCNGLR